MFQFWHYQLNCFFCAFRNWWFLNTHDCWSVFPVFERYRWRYNERFVLCFPVLLAESMVKPEVWS